MPKNANIIYESSLRSKKKYTLFLDLLTFWRSEKIAAHKMSIIVNVLIYSNKYHKVKIVKVKTVLVETP